MVLANSTGPLLIKYPYASHTRVLVTTINTIQVLRSPTLLDFHDLYTCGIKVIDVRNDPKYPISSIDDCGKLKSSCIVNMLFGDAYFIHNQVAHAGIGKTTIVKQILHGNHSGKVGEEGDTIIGTIFCGGITQGGN
jgi:hypothetical protein